MTKRIPVTYFYQEDKNYRVEARYVGSKISYTATVDSREKAISLEKAIKMDPHRYNL